MATGYTADVADGTIADFATFALQCARAFGATIMQRDNPMSEPPQLRVESDYNLKACEAAKQRLIELSALSESEADDMAALDYGKAVRARDEAKTRRDSTLARYESMLADVIRWEPPTADHVELKAFMIEQLTKSIDWDCTDHSEAPARLSGPMWLEEEKKRALRNVGYHAKAHAEEIERCAAANRWIIALYESLNQTAPRASHRMGT
jgi:hypothetical protein